MSANESGRGMIVGRVGTHPVANWFWHAEWSEGNLVLMLGRDEEVSEPDHVIDLSPEEGQRFVAAMTKAEY